MMKKRNSVYNRPKINDRDDIRGAGCLANAAKIVGILISCFITGGIIAVLVNLIW